MKGGFVDQNFLNCDILYHYYYKELFGKFLKIWRLSNLVLCLWEVCLPNSWIGFGSVTSLLEDLRVLFEQALLKKFGVCKVVFVINYPKNIVIAFGTYLEHHYSNQLDNCIRCNSSGHKKLLYRNRSHIHHNYSICHNWFH